MRAQKRYMDAGALLDALPGDVHQDRFAAYVSHERRMITADAQRDLESVRDQVRGLIESAPPELDQAELLLSKARAGQAFRSLPRQKRSLLAELAGVVARRRTEYNDELNRSYDVQYCVLDPKINRLAGIRISQFGDLVTPLLGFVVFPGLLLLLLWLQSIVDLKLTLARGDAGVAEITGAEPVAAVVPSMLRVRYRFRDYHARWCGGVHWVRARSPLGERLRAGEVQVVVIHDRRRPERSRLVVALDFVPGAPHPAGVESAETA